MSRPDPRPSGPADAAPRIVLFDIDGTLLLSGGAGKRALNRLFERCYRVRDAFAGIRPHGMTDPAIFRQMIRNALDRDPASGEVDELGAAYVELLAEELADSAAFRLMPGIPELLARLIDRAGLHLGLATGNLAEASRLKLRRGGIDRYFAFGGFGSDSEDRAQLTRRAWERGCERAQDRAAAAFVIGDTVHDVRAARAIGASCLAVLTTGADSEALRREGARTVIADLSEVGAVLAFLGLNGHDRTG